MEEPAYQSNKCNKKVGDYKAIGDVIYAERILPREQTIY
jgi:hypothetical protein